MDSGNVISDHPWESDDGQFLNFTVKEYNASGVKQSFVYCRLSFRAVWKNATFAERKATILRRSESARKFSHLPHSYRPSESQATVADSDAPCSLGPLPNPEFEDEYIEDEPPLSKCHCRYCQGERELLGRLPGTETQAMRRLSEVIVHVVTTSLFTVLVDATIKQLLIQLRSAWLSKRFLPSCIRHLFSGKQLSSLECGVLEAFVIDELRKRGRTYLQPEGTWSSRSGPGVSSEARAVQSTEAMADLWVLQRPARLAVVVV